MLLTATNPPAWWTQRGVLNSSGTPNDYAAINQGQLKLIASKAYQEMETKLPGGAGPALTALINGFSATNNNYAPVNIGQLKNVAKLFYDRLIEIGYIASYPWTAITVDDNDYAAANIGQVKNLFSFDLTSTDAAHDVDGNGLPDWWERFYFGDIGQDPSADPDGDGLSNLQEFQQGTNPNNADTDDDGLPDGWEVAHNLNPNQNDAGLDPDGSGQTNLQKYRNTIVPAAPSGGTAARNPDGSVTFTWVDNSDNETEFVIRKKNDDGVWVEIGTVGSNQTSFTYFD